MSKYNVEPQDFDDVFIKHPESIHFEMLDVGQLWIGIDMPNGDLIHVNIGTEKPCGLLVRMEQVG